MKTYKNLQTNQQNEQNERTPVKFLTFQFTNQIKFSNVTDTEQFQGNFEIQYSCINFTHFTLYIK